MLAVPCHNRIESRLMRRLSQVAALLLTTAPAFADEYTFTVENNADQRIVGIEVSEDGKQWLPFDIGKGIAAGKSSLLAWDESTDASDCNWLFRATFTGGDVLESDWIDFCEEDVVVNFEFE